MSSFDITPKFHFFSKKNWINDPNGTIYDDGIYHLYYQYNPTGKTWGNIHWGHATTKDLINFEHLPIALYPSKDRGEHHCFSGSVIKKDNKFYFFYTSVGILNRNHVNGAEQWLVITDNLNDLSSEKIVVLTKDIHLNTNLTEWRDPFLYEQSGVYYMLLAGVIDGVGHILKYKSLDLINWCFEKSILSKKDIILECPNIVLFDNHYVLIWCEIEKRQVMCGILNKNFELIDERPFDFSKNTYYATNISINDKGEVFVWAWLQEDKRPYYYDNIPWVGTMSMVKKLSFDGSSINISAAADYFKNSTKINDIQKNLYLKTFVFNLSLTFTNSNCEILIFASKEEKITIKITENRLQCINNLGEIVSGIFNAENELKLDLFVDNSIIEGIINDKYCFTIRVYPKELKAPKILIESPITFVKTLCLKES